MIILGICAYHADCSASIVSDGRLIAAAEEERFTRVKHWAGFPEHAVRYCLKEAGVTIGEIDYIAVARDPKANLYHKIAYFIKTPSAWKKFAIKLNHKKVFESIENIFAEKFGISADSLAPKIRYVEHHMAHLASAYLVSPFEESVLISIDGFGDFVSAMYGEGRGGQINILKKVYYPHSIGIFYSMITQFLGFKKYGDEYKVMGLASYGEPRFLGKMEDIISYIGKGEYRLNLEYFRHHKIKLDFRWESGEPQMPDLFSEKLVKALGKPRDSNELITGFHRDLAASLQKHTENIFFEILNDVHNEIKVDNLSLAGGVAMNSVANGKVFKKTPFKEVYIPPAAGDAGNSLGAAFYVFNQASGNKKSFVLEHGYWGPEFDNEVVEKTIKYYCKELPSDHFDIEVINNTEELIDRVVDAIMDSKVVGWFQGRMEFGARALGNRSIIVDPRRHDMKDILNARIKKREQFRPFAPSILVEQVPEWFEESSPVPFMEKVYNIKEEKRPLIPAVTHVDGTGRLQSVKQTQNPLYYKLIKTFAEKTGVPILLNTSFNENEPIVCTPGEALEAFLRTRMDVVVLKDWIISRK